MHLVIGGKGGRGILQTYTSTKEYYDSCMPESEELFRKEELSEVFVVVSGL